MTTRARRFNIRKSATQKASPLGDAAKEDATPQERNEAEINARKEAALAAIREEGLTGRQLRTARRVAQKHGLTPISDFDAVRMLREQGIDPFKRSNMLDIVGPTGGNNQTNTLPQAETSPLPSTPFIPADGGFGELERIQKDIAKRRRRRLFMLSLRLLLLVFLPTAIAGYYYYSIATPMYATFSEMKVQQAQSPSSAPVGLLAGTQFATSEDSIVVQDYLQSREAMLRLDEALGFKSHFSQKSIDPVQRLDPDATNEAAYKLYKKNVKIGYDPTEGIIQMEVIAADPELATKYAEFLISIAEEQVDSLSQRVRDDQVEGARESYDEAELAVTNAQQRVIDLKELYDVISTELEVSLLTNRISALELRVTEDEIALQELNANPRPNRTKVATLERGIASRKIVIEDLRAQLTEGIAGGKSLARIQGELQIAESDLLTRVTMLQAALQNMELARAEAARQTRYLVTAVSPITPDEAAYPRAFENTVLAFLIFSGIYLLCSLTASILREQVSA
ncbi:capsule biosynthesis protein [Halocynthiibacter sp. C4]|uniref:capsule biosynthesis protein n=1 Tax=Halocynthiibacter sp. C4 TaxID=2992758 RepID=UPI00237AB826|nr:capsule biosynthesis protein [Halocynthiibacter sp. C4]MDE0590509.1 capsule biosynthesis protein [Halocynthiibacter sp. C4]